MLMLVGGSQTLRLRFWSRKPRHTAEKTLRDILNMRVMVYDKAQIDALGAAANDASTPIRLIMKLETGTQRQGLRPDEALQLARYIARFPYLVLEGTCSHFANIEDTTDHSFAQAQLKAFQDANDLLAQNGFRPALRTIANSGLKNALLTTNYLRIRNSRRCRWRCPLPFFSGWRTLPCRCRRSDSS